MYNSDFYLHTCARPVREHSSGKRIGIHRLLIFLGCITLPAAAQQVSLSLGSATAAAGGSVALNVSLAESGGSQPTSLEWSVTFPSTDISAINVVSAPALSGESKVVQCNAVTGVAICIASGLNDTAMAPGTIATVTFQIAPAPIHSSIPLGLSGVVAAAADGSGIAASGNGGTISLTSAVALNGLSCSSSNIATPGSANCTVTASGNAPNGGLTATLQSSSSSLSVPASVTIPSGTSSTGFKAVGAAVSSTTNALLTAAAGGVSKTFALTLSPPSSPVTLVSALSCAPNSLSSGSSSTCTAVLAKPAVANVVLAITSSSSLLSVPRSISIGTGSGSTTFTVKAGTVSTTSSATVTATGPNNYVTTQVTLKPGSGGGPKSLSVWAASAVPGTITDPDANPIEVGMKFRSDVAGSVTGIRFYKGSRNGGTHLGHLWSSTGKLLGSVVFTNETSQGWQQANLLSPVAIQANTTYIVSYYAPQSHYSSDEYYFNSAVNTPPLHALQNGADGPNGVYVYGSGGFPNQSWGASNYWVDVVFSPAN